MPQTFPQLSAAPELLPLSLEDWQDRIKRAPIAELGKFRGDVLLDHQAGHLAHAEALQLDRQIDARLRPEPAQRRAGSKPRTPESMARRRRWVAPKSLPPAARRAFHHGRDGRDVRRCDGMPEEWQMRADPDSQ